MATPLATAEHYRSQQRLGALTVAGSRRAWSRMGSDFAAGWTEVGPRLLMVTTAAQLTAARNGARYLPTVLRETGQADDPVGQVNARAFVGIAADGRSLEGLLYGAVTEAKAAVALGDTPATALLRGGRWLDMAVQTTVADTGRSATGVGIAARPTITGYVRMLNPPSCSRCAVLAGKTYRWNQGFLRHPRCDCVHIPASEDVAADLRTDPKAAFASGQVTDLRAGERKAIAEGADPSQVINARRGHDGIYTTEGTTKRGAAGPGQRLTPDGIYAQATSRDDAIRLLREHSYLI